MDIYGSYRLAMERAMNDLVSRIEKCALTEKGEKLYEHLAYRIKSDSSMREKLTRKSLEETTENALL